jgi:hydrogenase maturation protein HypF
VFIEVDGARDDIQRFYMGIVSRPPVLAEIHESSITFGRSHGFEEFSIIGSGDDSGGFTPVSPDIATCDACLREIFDSSNRRFRYPFTNCTDCGPRFTIITSIPYDRKNTTMDVFPMCPPCREEYENPLDRRYHAQPNACGTCGPSLRLFHADGTIIESDPIEGAVSLLREGGIVAIKGLGGYHLSVFPEEGGRIERLRRRKRRPGKPFALMARDVDTVRRYCEVSEREERLLQSPERPIVLLRRRSGGEYLPSEVAPDTDRLGIMLPYTPLHHLLLREGPEILVMTSANLSEEPLCYTDEDAVSSLVTIADAFLTHDRGIHRPCDDSVVMVVDGSVVHLRRSRGYVPRMIKCPSGERQLLAAGASEKNTFCVFKEGKAFVSHHIGDLNNEKSFDAYTRGIHDFLDMFRVKPEALACDLHPDYESTRYAEKLSSEWGIPLFRIQHHHAHIGAVLGENETEGPVIGVALDGTGYGPDETVWGGEFLIAERAGYERVGHLKSVPMPGGERCIEESWRMGISYLLDAYGSADDIPDTPLTRVIGAARISQLEAIIRAGVNTVHTSSCGRLFDAVSAILGLCYEPAYDAQGAILLEHTAGTMKELVDPFTYSIDDGVVNYEETIRDIVAMIGARESLPAIARRFHATIVLSTVEQCERMRGMKDIERVALGGGVFQNALLLHHIPEELRKRGFSVCMNTLLPPNDGDISYGQGIAALALLEGGA